MVLDSNLSDPEYEDYQKYGDAYFGGARQSRHESKDVFDFYEWLVDCYSETPRERLLKLAEDRTDIERLAELNHFDLVLEVCEGWAASVEGKRKHRIDAVGPPSAE